MVEINKSSVGRKTISVIGLGYVGLVTAVGFGLQGHRIIGIDIDKRKVECINKRICPLFEEGVDEAIKAIDIKATTDYADLLQSEVTFICVNTPSDGDGSMNGEFLRRAVKETAAVLECKDGEHLIVIRSTMVPGTTEELVIPLLNHNRVCVNPEFLKEGTALYDFQNPHRIIIGEKDRNDGDLLQAMYADFSCEVMRTNVRTAEMIKYASNAFLASKLSIINEIGNICKLLGIDVNEVAHGMGLDKRIGSQFLQAGVGFGGSCFPKDVHGLIAKAKAVGYCPRILEEVLRLNDEQPQRLLKILEKYLPIEGSTIGVLGLAFKPGTDDIREARSIVVVGELCKRNARVKAYDPQAVKNFKEIFPDIDYVTAQEALNADAVLILTEWAEFEELDYAGKTVIDGRGIKAALRAKIYEGICW
jgi:UDPglucose 6-dehydrogenase